MVYPPNKEDMMSILVRALCSLSNWGPGTRSCGRRGLLWETASTGRIVTCVSHRRSTALQLTTMIVSHKMSVQRLTDLIILVQFLHLMNINDFCLLLLVFVVEFFSVTPTALQTLCCKCDTLILMMSFTVCCCRYRPSSHISHQLRRRCCFRQQV